MNDTQQPELPGLPVRDQGVLPPFVEGVLFLICGLIIGAGVTVYVMDHSVRGFLTQPDQLPDRLLRQMDQRLDLSVEQRAEAEDIIAEHFATFDALRRTVQPDIQATLDSLRAEVAEILEPEQRNRWEANFDRIREKWQPGPILPDAEGEIAEANPRPR